MTATVAELTTVVVHAQVPRRGPYAVDDMSRRLPHACRTSGVTRDLHAVLPLVWAVVFVLLAGLLACLEAALSRVSRVRVEELVREERPGALRLQKVLADPPRSLNLLLLLRTLSSWPRPASSSPTCLDRSQARSAVVARGRRS